MRSQRRIVFEDAWFDAGSTTVPSWDPPFALGG
jgi:hypothetical protein